MRTRETIRWAMFLALAVVIGCGGGAPVQNDQQTMGAATEADKTIAAQAEAVKAQAAIVKNEATDLPANLDAPKQRLLNAATNLMAVNVALMSLGAKMQTVLAGIQGYETMRADYEEKITQKDKEISEANSSASRAGNTIMAIVLAVCFLAVPAGLYFFLSAHQANGLYGAISGAAGGVLILVAREVMARYGQIIALVVAIVVLGAIVVAAILAIRALKKVVYGTAAAIDEAKPDLGDKAGVLLESLANWQDKLGIQKLSDQLRGKGQPRTEKPTVVRAVG